MKTNKRQLFDLICVWVIIAFLMIGLGDNGVASSQSASKATKIEGYGDIKLGAPLDSLNLDEYEELPIRPEGPYVGADPPVVIYNRLEPFDTTNTQTTASLSVFSQSGVIEAVTLTFLEPDAWDEGFEDFSDEVAAMFRDKYDSSLEVGTTTSDEGKEIRFQDEDSHLVRIVISIVNVSCQYSTLEFYNKFWGGGTNQSHEQMDKI